MYSRPTLALLAALVGGGWASVGGQVQVVGIGHGPVLAQTTCHEDGSFTVGIDTTQPVADQRLALVHEMTHVGQIAHMGCAVAESLYATRPSYRFRMELDAYCAEARVQDRNGQPVTNPMAGAGPSFSLYMFLAYGQMLYSLDSVRTLIRTDCPLLSEDRAR